MEALPCGHHLPPPTAPSTGPGKARGTLARMATSRMRARAVAAFRCEFTDSGWEFHDVGVALDEIAALRPASDPIVLRVTSEPDSEPAAWAASVLGEWLCEADGSEPKRLGSVMLPGSDWVWWLSPLSGWEGCDEPILPLRIALAAGVDRKKIASAVGSRMRLWTSFNDPSNRRCRRAIRLVESWTQGKSDADGVIAAGEAARHSGRSLPIGHERRLELQAAYELCRLAQRGHSDDVAFWGLLRLVAHMTAGSGAAWTPDDVRKSIPTLAFLRPLTGR